MTELKSIKSFYWGLDSYESTQTRQLDTWKKVANEGHPGFILGGEIRPTITQGVRAQESDILDSQHFEVFKVQRGGETTLHSPGQLVIYPILNIKSLKMGVRAYVELLLKISVETFKDFGLTVSASVSPVGLFSSVGKIGFCGLQIKQGVSLHGLSLNVTNDLKHFDSIVSCGLKSTCYDKLENYVPHISPEAVFSRWVETACLEGILQKSQNPATSLNLKAPYFAESSGLPFPNPDL